MIVFSPLRTPRLQVDLQELRAVDAIVLCHIPVAETEFGTTEFLKRAIVPAAAARQGQETDPRKWSVQERAFVVAHYMAHVIGGDFQVGESGKYSDYLVDGLGSPPAAISLGEVGGRQWYLQPLLGWHAESIERLIQAEDLTADRNGWLVGSMAAQLYSADLGPLACAGATDAAIDDQVRSRATALTELPESEFMQLVLQFHGRGGELDHIFIQAIGDEGPMFLPSKEVPELPPARFHFSMAIRADTAAIFGQGQ